MYIFVYCISPLVRGFSCIFAHLYMYYICGLWPLWNTTSLFLTWYQSPEFRVPMIAVASSPRHPLVPVLAVALFPRIPTSTSSPVLPVALPRPRGVSSSWCTLRSCTLLPASRVLPAWIPALSVPPVAHSPSPPPARVFWSATVASIGFARPPPATILLLSSRSADQPRSRCP
jgi:hypothetical protein